MRPILRVPCILAVFAGAYATWLYATDNFHEVIPRTLYRSAQPEAGDLVAYKREFGIRTVINLRGENIGAKWYDEEVAASERLGINHVDFRMSSSRQLETADAIELIRILRTAETPILIHCKSGADRTGLTAAFYLAAVAKSGEEAAERQLSINFGHLSIPYLSAAYPMDESFEAMEPNLLGFTGS